MAMLGHDGAVIRLRRTAAVFAGVALLAGSGALTGCSALSGRDDSGTDHVRTPVPSTAASASTTAGARFEHAATVKTVLAAAKQDFETVYTYDYRNLPKYVRAGLAVTTAPYATKYRTLLQGANATQLRAGQIVEVPAADLVGLADLAADGKSAIALVHSKITTSSAGTSTPKLTTVTAVLELRLIGRTWRISTLTVSTKATGTIPANPELMAAMSAVRTGLGRIFGLRRAHFAADFALALSVTTGDLHDSLTQQKSALKDKLTSGGYDLSSTINGLGAVRAGGTSAEFIVAVNQYRIGRQGAKFGPYRYTFDVTAKKVTGTWRLSAATPTS
jgi:hypothetical protein